MARIADLFTKGGYSKALKERDRIADATVGNTGYANTQNEAMRMALMMARGRNAELQGQAMSENLPAAQRIALAAQANESPAIDTYALGNSLNKRARETAENRIAQQQAIAMNKREKIKGNLQAGIQGWSTGAKLNPLVQEKRNQEETPYIQDPYADKGVQ